MLFAVFVLATIMNNVSADMDYEDEDEEDENVDDNFDEPDVMQSQEQERQQQHEQQERDSWVNFPPSHPDVDIKCVFPDNMDLRVEIGHALPVVLGAVNNYVQPMNLSFALGSLHSPFDHTLIIQKLAPVKYNAIIDADEERSFEYILLPASNLEEMDLTTSLTAYYMMDDQMFATTFFNGTISFYENKGLLHPENLTFVTLCFVSVCFVYFFTFLAFGNTKVWKKTARNVAIVTGSSTSTSSSTSSSSSLSSSGAKKESSATDKKDSSSDWVLGYDDPKKIKGKKKKA